MSRRETVVNVSGPGDLIAALPHMLRYVPGESIVLVCMQGRRKRTHLTLRYDLDLAAYPDELCADAVPRVEAVNPSAVLVVVFGEEPPTDGLPYRELAEALGEALDETDVPELDIVYTYGDRWWSYLCDDPRCCPPEGGEVDLGSQTGLLLAAEHAYAGAVVLPSRKALKQSISYAESERIEERSKAMEAAITDTLGLSPETARRLGHRMALDLLERFVDPRTTLSDDEVAELVGIAVHLWGRDEFLVHGADPEDRELLVRVMCDVVRRVPPPYDAPVCGILGWLTYASGDGTVANIAVERALASDPSYSLALLIRSGLDQQISPDLLQQAMVGAGDDLHGRSAGS